MLGKDGGLLFVECVYLRCCNSQHQRSFCSAWQSESEIRSLKLPPHPHPTTTDAPSVVSRCYQVCLVEPRRFCAAHVWPCGCCVGRVHSPEEIPNSSSLVPLSAISCWTSPVKLGQIHQHESSQDGFSSTFLQRLSHAASVKEGFERGLKFQE